MELTVALIAAALVLGAIWLGGWIRAAIENYEGDENHH